MNANDYFHAVTVAWFHEPELDEISTLTSETLKNMAVLRDRKGRTLALVHMLTDRVWFDRRRLQQFDKRSGDRIHPLRK
jgi:hypothetical protein